MLIRLHQLIEQSAERHPDRPALTFRDETLSYAGLWAQVRAAAAGLADAGVHRGDRVAVYLDKRLETVIASFAAFALGAVLVPVNPVLRAPQVHHILTDSGARVLITNTARLATLSSSPEIVVLLDGTGGELSWQALVTGRDDPRLPAGVDTDLAAILYTSGSTGRPKGVMLSHRNLLVGAASVSSYLSNDQDDVILSVLPLSFDAGFSQLTTAFLVGAQVVLVNYLLPAEVPKLCARHGVTGLTCVPPLWIQLVGATWPDEARARLRYFANTGGRMPKTTLDQLRELFPAAAPYLMYGLTEAFRSTYLDPGEVDRRPDSIGTAIPNAEILVIDADGRLCGPGQEGELVHRGPLVAGGYWNDPERTAERFRPLPPGDHVWQPGELAVWSGDTVVRDDEGFLYFVGRSDEMIKTSGYRVSPTEIEETAYATGLVRDAVALGLPDERLGQRIVLLVAGPQDSASDADHLARELLVRFRSTVPLFMVPGEVIVRNSLPRSANGKFDRVLLRDELT